MPTFGWGEGSIYYEDSGHGDAVLLLHGWAGSGIDLARLRGELGDGFRVVTADLPGSGRSEPQPREYSANLHAEDARALLPLTATTPSASPRCSSSWRSPAIAPVARSRSRSKPRASGRSISITHRRIKNDRFAAAGWVWAVASIVHNEHARTHYQRRRDHGDRHSSALRHLFNRQLGQLWHCLQTGQHYSPERAFTRESVAAAESAAA